MKRLLLLQLIAICFLSAAAQKKKNDEKFDFAATGTFSKPRIVPGMDKLAIAQATVIFKQATTKEHLENERGAFGGRKSGGGSVSGRLTAYLETTDGELTDADYQEITDHFYTYLNTQLNQAGIKTVSWDKITSASFYKDNDDKDDVSKAKEENKKNGQIALFYNANKGNTIRNYNPAKAVNPGFAFGKIKKAASFSDDLDAPLLFLHAVVDFADILLDADVKTGESSTYLGSGMTRITKSKNFKFNSTVVANVKVSGESDWDGKYMGGEHYFYNGKSQADMLTQIENISSNEKFATEVSQDPEKGVLKRGAYLGLTKNFNAVPVVVSTTKDAYKKAAKKALENYASELVAFFKTKA